VKSGQAPEQEFAEAVRRLFSRPGGVEAQESIADPAGLGARLASLRHRLGLFRTAAAANPGRDGGDESDRQHPGDIEPILRSVVEIAAELIGLGAGLGLHGSPEGTRLGITLAAVLRTLDTLPEIRQRLETVFGTGGVELVLRMLDSVDQALLHGLAGPVVSLVEEALQLRARLQHRRRWELIEAEDGSPGQGAPASPPCLGERPLPLPAGPIERYSEKAAMLSLGGFGFGLAATGNLAGAEAAVLGGLPRPGILGRTAFCLELGRRLEAAGALLLDPVALERLDRIDTVVFDRDLLDPCWGPALLAAARQSGLLRVLAADPEDPSPGDVERRIPRGEASIAAVRALQAEGKVVLLLATADLPALGAADLGVGFRRGGTRPPWSAHVIAGEDLDAAWLLLAAIDAARRCASQSVQASLMEVVAALALCLEGLSERSTLEVNRVAHLLALVAMGNGLRLARQVDPRPPQPAADTVPWHALEVEEVLERLATRREGLPSGTAPGRAGNAAPPGAGSGFARLLLHELDTPLVPILTTGATLSALMGSPVDAGLILAVLGFNGVIGAIQRQRVEGVLAGLQARHAAPVWVRRGGVAEQIDSEGLLVGDLVLLEAGEVVPADCRIVMATGLQVDEAVLTGESFPLNKGPEASAAAALAERTSMLYQGTTVVAGEATAVVVAVGEATEGRRGLEAVRNAATAGGVEARLESLTDLTTPIATLSGAAVLLSALARGQEPRQALSEAVALAVAAVPEGLPVLASLAQFAAAGRLSGEKVLVRNPRAVESLGRVDVICLDKTGTLTSGRIQLVQVWAAGNAMPPDGLDEVGREVVRIALWATPIPEPGKRLAHPTDRATRKGAELAGVDGDGWTPLESLPFEPARGYHASLGLLGDHRLLCIKGSPEVVLAACEVQVTASGIQPLQESERERLGTMAQALAERGLRVLAVARRCLDEPGPLQEHVLQQLEFLGFIGLADPVRPTARAALEDLRRAGIAVKIITGDHPATAAAVAESLQLSNDGTVLTGPMVEAMDDAALQRAVLEASVFARVTSMQKLRLVRALQRAGRVVAMTGDGANDAPAIRLAQVGIALGERATEAARLAADIVVTDGHIETIVRAVLEGRALWRSVRDAVGLLVGGNLGEIGFTLFTGLIEGQPALNTRQLLLLNVLTDVAPALAIAMRPPGNLDPEELLREGPDASLGRALDQDILRKAAVTALTSGMARAMAGAAANRPRADTVGLLTLVGTQLGQMVATGRADALTLLTGLGSAGGLVATVQTPGLSHAFGCRPLGPLGLLQAGAATALGTGVGIVLPWLETLLTPSAPSPRQHGSADAANPP
jgi:cation-transporting ATPase I